MKYCGVSTPFKSVRAYARSAMEMRGSEAALEELMYRVFGNLLEEGILVKLADALYCGANTAEQLLTNWKRVLQALHRCDLNLSVSKSVIFPRTTTVWGWIWHQGRAYSTGQFTSHSYS